MKRTIALLGAGLLFALMVLFARTSSQTLTREGRDQRELREFAVTLAEAQARYWTEHGSFANVPALEEDGYFQQPKVSGVHVAFPGDSASGYHATLSHGRLVGQNRCEVLAGAALEDSVRAALSVPSALLRCTYGSSYGRNRRRVRPPVIETLYLD